MTPQELNSKAPKLAGDPLEARFTEIGARLQESIQAVLTSLPPEFQGGPQHLSDTLSLPKVFVSQLLKAMRSTDAIAVPYHLPGPEPVKKFLKTAKRHGAPTGLVRRATDVVNEFQTVIRTEVGDQSALETMISAWLPQARESFEVRRKQIIYRGMSQLMGTSAETLFQTAILHPDREGARVDLCLVQGVMGWRQLRAGASVELEQAPLGRRGSELVNLHGQRVESRRELRLESFCEAPAHASETSASHASEPGAVYGLRAQHDLVTARMQFDAVQQDETSDRPYSLMSLVRVPTKALQFDVFVHRAVFQGVFPELKIYQATFSPAAETELPYENARAVDLLAELLPLGQGLRNARSPRVKRYDEIVRYALQARGWSADDFLTYRCATDYPLFGTGLAVSFQPLAE